VRLGHVVPLLPQRLDKVGPVEKQERLGDVHGEGALLASG
jgi:hypothetical protein